MLMTILHVVGGRGNQRGSRGPVPRARSACDRGARPVLRGRRLHARHHGARQARGMHNIIINDDII